MSENIATQALVIDSMSIRNDGQGRYCLNDLHKAAGNAPRHKPSNFLALEKTQEIINELALSEISDRDAIQPVTNLQGGNSLQGTYAGNPRN